MSSRESDTGMSGVIETIRPHPNYLWRLYVSTLLIFAMFVLPFIILGLVPELGWGYIIVFAIANALWMIPFFLLYPAYYRSIRYELREDEIVVYKGIITRSTKVVPYRTVTNLHLKRDLLDRWLFNLGTVNVETAGKSGETGAEQSLVGLEDCESVLSLVRQELRRYRSSAATTTEVQERSTAEAAMLANILNELREIKQVLLRK